MKTSAKRLASNRAWKARNKEQISEAGKSYYAENRESCLAKVKARADTMRPEVNAYTSQWRKDNRGTCNAYNGAYRAATLQQTPSWSETDEIKELYSWADHLQEVTGIQMHVDHVVPLRGKHVSGLHCVDNLKVITAKENLSKGNKHESD